jgi:hypothetical protein
MSIVFGVCVASMFGLKKLFLKNMLHMTPFLKTSSNFGFSSSSFMDRRKSHVAAGA